jgi:hypothetical protein
MTKLKVGQRVAHTGSGRAGVIVQVKSWYVVVRCDGARLETAWSNDTVKRVG